MLPANPTLFVTHFPDRQVDRVRAPQRILSRDKQVRSAAEALRVVVSGRLHIRDAECEMQYFYGSPLKNARGGSENWFRRPPTRKVQGQAMTSLAFLAHSSTRNQNHLTLEMTWLFLSCYSLTHRTRRAVGSDPTRSREEPRYSCLALNLGSTV
jgi:hypothetical protein